MINLYGLVLLVVLMIPNIVYLQKNKTPNIKIKEKPTAEIIEQMSRYGCIIFTLINTGLYEYGFVSQTSIIIWIIVSAVLATAYYVLWFLFFKFGEKLYTAVPMAVIPGFMFVFSGIMMRRWVMVFFSAVFWAAHTYVTYQKYKNVKE